MLEDAAAGELIERNPLTARVANDEQGPIGISRLCCFLSPLFFSSAVAFPRSSIR
jgi:hypothetical protein